MIKPFVAGQFYESGFDALNKQVEECFKSEFGPGDLPLKRKSKGRLFGIISPHAGYQFSGPCQAWAYKEVAESKFPKTFIILGPDHNGMHSTYTTSMEDWETPFGVVKADKSFIIDLLDKCNIVVKGSIMEHSLEVQLPFLQYVCKDKIKDVRIVPIAVPTSAHYDRVAEIISEISEDVCVIISSDFTHYGPQFLYTPFRSDVKKNLYALDEKSVGFLKKLNVAEFLKHINETRSTVCGSNAIALGVEVMKNLFAKKGMLLSYYTSGDVIGDYANAVGYAAVKFI